MGPLAEFLLFLAALVTGIIVFISVLKVHPAVTLAIAAVVSGWVLGLSFPDIGLAMLDGTIGILTGIGVVIALGAILGKIMEASGALEVLTLAVLNTFGKDRPVTALAILGLVVGIPVFCDSGFIILASTANRIENEFSLKHGVAPVALAGGLYTAHTLIPPTPGPVAAAGNLGMGNQLGLVILSGLIISAVIVVTLILLSRLLFKASPKKDVVLHSPKNPSLNLLLPIVLALVIISAGSVLSLLLDSVPPAITYLTHPVTALLISCLIAWYQVPSPERQTGLLKSGFMSAVPVIVITAMGGAFGAVLKKSSMAEILENTFAETGGTVAGLFIIGYLVALILKTAQGSSTASLVITSSIMFPLILTAELSPWETALMIGAIGSGSMAVSHANDSFFWVVTRFSGLTVRQGYLRFSLTTLLLSLSGLVTCLLLLLL